MNPRDEVSLLRVINFPRRGLGDGAISTLTEIAKANKLGLLETVLQLEELGAPSSLVNKLSDFKNKYLN